MDFWTPYQQNVFVFVVSTDDVRSKAWVCGCWLAGVERSNPVQGGQVQCLRRADNSFSGVWGVNVI